MSIEITIEIPALERLCDWLESGSRAKLMGEVRDDIVGRLKDAAGDGTLEKAATQPTEKPTAPVEATPATANKESRALPAHEIVTLDAVQRAAAQMRDDGKLKAVTDMFPEFGIKKLSELKGDQLQTFGERLRAMGAKI